MNSNESGWMVHWTQKNCKSKEQIVDAFDNRAVEITRAQYLRKLVQVSQSEKLHHMYQTLARLPYSVHDIQTMRIFTGEDPVMGLSESQMTTDHGVDVILSKENKNFKNYGISAEFDGDLYLDHLKTPSPRKRGVSIHSISSSTYSKGKKSMEDFKASKDSFENETSVETGAIKMDSARTDRELLVSETWIRRWRHNQPGTTQKKTEDQLNFCESNEEFIKKQSPSIAAMAMVGKSMIRGLQPSELQRKGSFVVWKC